MAKVVWEVVRLQQCERVGRMVTLEVQHVYPAEVLPDQPPQVIARRCSLGTVCNLLDKPACCWAGTLPGFDPLT
jgi:hypothetical protein